MEDATPRPPRAALLAATIALVVVVALPGGGAAGPSSTSPGVPAAPLGGPVDDGWLPAGGAGFSQFAGEPPPAGSPVWPGVRRDVRSTALADGRRTDVQILHLDPGAPVQVRPTLAGGSVRGIAPVAAQSGDPLTYGVAAVNGGFWLGEPFGEPNGLFALDGRLISDAESQGVGPRGAVGWTDDGRLLVDRVDSTESLTLADGTALTVDGLNRGHRELDEPFGDGVDSLLAYTADHGGPVTVAEPKRPAPPAPAPGEPTPPPPPPVDLAVVRIAVPRWPSTGALTGTVTAVGRDAPGTFTPQPGEVLVVGTGADAAALDDVAVGDAVVVSTAIEALEPARDAEWAQVDRALAGGPMIVKGSQLTDPDDWVDEGFEPHIHSDVRAPRTAIGVTADGRVLMVTADGRRPGITHGFTIAELGRYMIALGAVEAVSLDGGGSSQMVVDGILRNTPCCDAQVRAVATSLQVVHGEAFDGTDRLRGAGRVDTAAAVARHAHPDGADVAVLAVASAFPDALAGGPLAAVVGGPLLLTGADGLPEPTAAVLADLGVDRVVLLGGEAVIGPEVVADLAAAGITAQRVAGGSRFDTAAAIADAVDRVVAADPGREVTRAFLASAGGFADALVAAGPGGILDMPVLLSEPDQLHPATVDALRGLDEVVLVGGTSRLSSALESDLRARGLEVTRLAGTGRFGTARAVNDWLATQAELGDGLVVATGDDFPDALAGGPLAAALRAPLMIVPGGQVDADADAAAFFAGLPPRSGVDVLGGFGVVSSYQQWQLEQLIEGGPGIPGPVVPPSDPPPSDPPPDDPPPDDPPPDDPSDDPEPPTPPGPAEPPDEDCALAPLVC